MDTITVKVFRYDPAVDEAPYYKSYTVPWKEYLTALQVVHYINDNIEPIGFDYSCCGGLCGRCGMMIDGRPGLACYTPLTNEDHTFEPLAGFPVVKDLFADKSALTKKLDDTHLAVQTVKSMKNDDMPAIDYEYYWETLERLNMCRECGNCSAVCPVLAQDAEGYAGPAAFGQMYLRANDGLDQRDRVLDAVVGGVFNCLLCGMCTEVCPSHIDHVKLHTELRAAAIERGLVPEGASENLDGVPMPEYAGFPADPAGPAASYGDAVEGAWIDRAQAEVVEEGGIVTVYGADGDVLPLTENIMITGTANTPEYFA